MFQIELFDIRKTLYMRVRAKPTASKEVYTLRRSWELRLHLHLLRKSNACMFITKLIFRMCCTFETNPSRRLEVKTKCETVRAHAAAVWNEQRNNNNIRMG